MPKGLKGFQKGHPRLNTYGFPIGHTPFNKEKKIQTNTGRTHFKKGRVAENYKPNFISCEICQKEFHRQPSSVSKTNFCSMKCKKIWESQNKRGKNNPNWTGGHGKERHTEMGRIEYKQWRMSVFQRDGFKCQGCGNIGGTLNAHHIKFWKDYPELRYVLDNGITLCEECHYLVHKIK